MFPSKTTKPDTKVIEEAPVIGNPDALDEKPEEWKLTFRLAMALASLGLCYEAVLISLIMPANVIAYINADIGKYLSK
jgi:hypothetical protein